jgi:hypothetical protein
LRMRHAISFQDRESLELLLTFYVDIAGAGDLGRQRPRASHTSTNLPGRYGYSICACKLCVGRSQVSSSISASRVAPSFSRSSSICRAPQCAPVPIMVRHGLTTSNRRRPKSIPNVTTRAWSLLGCFRDKEAIEGAARFFDEGLEGANRPRVTGVGRRKSTWALFDSR